MIEKHYYIEGVPVVEYGEKTEKVILYVHGKCGNAEEGGTLSDVAVKKGYYVISAELPEHGVRKEEKGFDPWHVVPELQAVMCALRKEGHDVYLYAVSIGAYFSMLAFAAEPPTSSLFVSPILDMKRLIGDMMKWANVTPERLAEEGEIVTPFGETLSQRYLDYATENPIPKWDGDGRTFILYAERDNLTGRATVDAFAEKFKSKLTVMADGEHYFHTEEQLEFLRAWEEDCLDRIASSKL